MKRIGFTGTRRGLSKLQRVVLERFFAQEPMEFHHGDCVGADSEAHDLADRRYNTIVVHPPFIPAYRAHKRAMTASCVVRQPESYAARNAAIVRETDKLVACPRETWIAGMGTGGTWNTIELAMRAGKPVSIVWSCGRITIVQRDPSEKEEAPR